MNLAELWAEIESEHKWRQDEIRFFQNQLVNLNTEDQKGRYRRALVLILYAHVEGFCRFALTLYVNAVNLECITCGDASYAIAAASLHEMFQALRDPQKKCPEFENNAPDDRKLHLFARDREFIERIDQLNARTVSIPDRIVDTESNLSPTVLRKNLYRLGLRHDEFDHLDGHLSHLLARRNTIAHGEPLSGLTQEQYSDYQAAVYQVIEGVKRGVMDALAAKAYLRRS